MDKWTHRLCDQTKVLQLFGDKIRATSSLVGFMPRYFSTTLYVFCPLPNVLFPFMYVFVYYNENIRSLREKSQSVEVSWEGDIGDSSGPLLASLLVSFICSLQYPCKYLSLLYRWGPEAQRDISCPRLLWWQ